MVEPTIAWIFRFFTLLSVGYLVFDRYYETSAVITSPASDPENPFYFPFSLTNTSHIFSMKKLDWACKLVKMKYENGAQFDNEIITERSQKPVVVPGGVTNIYCNRKSIKVENSKLSMAVVQLQAQYDINIFGLYYWRRNSDVATFTWMAAPTGGGQQWIKGEP